MRRDEECKNNNCHTFFPYNTGSSKVIPNNVNKYERKSTNTMNKCKLCFQKLP